MNKTILIVLGIVVVIALILGAAGLFVAMRNRATAFGPGGFGMMQNYGWSQQGRGGQQGRGMMGGGRFQANDVTPRVNMQEYMVKALATELGVSEDDLTAEFNKGTTLLELPAVQEMTVKDLSAKLTAARTAAVDQALADGVITKAQAEIMKEADRGWMMGGFGFGFRR